MILNSSSQYLKNVKEGEKVSKHIYITPEEYAEAEKNGVCKNTLERRIRTYGWDKERAITTKVQKRDSIGIKEWIKKAESNGICKNTFLKRLYFQKWDKERAATQPIDKRYSRIYREQVNKITV